jgi:hypothetical protein
MGRYSIGKDIFGYTQRKGLVGEFQVKGREGSLVSLLKFITLKYSYEWWNRWPCDPQQGPQRRECPKEPCEGCVTLGNLRTVLPTRLTYAVGPTYASFERPYRLVCCILPR